MKIKITPESRQEQEKLLNILEKLKRVITREWNTDADIEVYRVYECRYDERTVPV